PDERRDHGNRMEDGNEGKAVSFHPSITRCEHESGETHSEQEDERHEVLCETLDSDGALVVHAPTHGKDYASDDEERRPDEPVKEEKCHGRFVRKAKSREAENDRLVEREVSGNGAKVQPAEDERERDRHGEKAAPHD